MAIASIDKEIFGQINGQDVHLYTLRNLAETEIKITNYGGIITSWTHLNRQRKRSNIVLGFDNLTDYLGQPFYLGAIIGRYANLIEKSAFSINGVTYPLPKNHNEHHLHGGVAGFGKKIWDVTVSNENCSIELSYLSKHLEEGYPGNLRVKVGYELTDNNELIITYECNTDQTTIVNLTNHSYFNLNDGFEQDILNHELLINADFYTPTNPEKITTGEILPLIGTPFDFTKPKLIGDYISTVGGYNHNFVLRNPATQPIKAASLAHPANGKRLDVYTDAPGLQFYTGNSLTENFRDRSDALLKKYSGVCLETQQFPNAINRSNFPSTLLQPGETFKSTTIYQILDDFKSFEP